MDFQAPTSVGFIRVILITKKQYNIYKWATMKVNVVSQKIFVIPTLLHSLHV